MAKVRGLHPDLIILDLSMPVMNGFEAARKINKIQPGVPIILYTLTDVPEVRREAAASGIRAVVPKKAGIGFLLEAVESALGNRGRTDDSDVTPTPNPAPSSVSAETVSTIRETQLRPTADHTRRVQGVLNNAARLDVPDLSTDSSTATVLVSHWCELSTRWDAAIRPQRRAADARRGKEEEGIGNPVAGVRDRERRNQRTAAPISSRNEDRIQWFRNKGSAIISISDDASTADFEPLRSAV